MANILVLGAGMVGSVIAADLARDDDLCVTIADLRDEALKAARDRANDRIETAQIDLSAAGAIQSLAERADVVAGALSSSLGYAALEQVIRTRRHYCDISFMSEDALQLDAMAKEHDVAAIVDCGVAPGMSNLIAGHAAAQFTVCHSISIYVGGIPRHPLEPFRYKAAFAPSDVIEEYTRPVRMVEHGSIVMREALSEPEQIHFDGIEPLEAFNTDGLRSLIQSLGVENMSEKTVRYRGHRELMLMMRDAGFFSHDPVTINGQTVRPIDFTQQMLFPHWTYRPGEEDMTLMRIIARGERDRRPQTMQWDLVDSYDRESQATSMARTTGLPCAIVARMLAKGEISQRGVLPPEVLVQNDGLFEHVMAELASRNIQYAFSSSI